MSFVAVSKVTFPPSLREDIQAFGSQMLPLAKSHRGFVSISFHQSTEVEQTMMYWEWESRADHEACMSSSDWMALMQSAGDLFERDGVEFSVETYDRLA